MPSTIRPRPQERPWPAPRGPNAPRRVAVTERPSRPTRWPRTPTAPTMRQAPAPARAPSARTPPRRQAGIERHAGACRLHSMPSSTRSGRSTSAQDLAALPWITLHTKAIWLPVLITIGSHDRDRRDRRERHGDRLAVHLLRRLPGDRRGLHRRLPRTAGELGRRDRGRPRVGGLLRRAWRERSAARRRSPSNSRSMRQAPASRRSSTRRSWAPSSPPPRPGIAASSPCRARTGTVASRRPRSSARATAGRAAASQKAPPSADGSCGHFGATRDGAARCASALAP